MPRYSPVRSFVLLVRLLALLWTKRDLLSYFSRETFVARSPACEHAGDFAPRFHARPFEITFVRMTESRARTRFHVWHMKVLLYTVFNDQEAVTFGFFGRRI